MGFQADGSADDPEASGEWRDPDDSRLAARHASNVYERHDVQPHWSHCVQDGDQTVRRHQQVDQGKDQQ